MSRSSWERELWKKYGKNRREVAAESKPESIAAHGFSGVEGVSAATYSQIVQYLAEPHPPLGMAVFPEVNATAERAIDIQVDQIQQAVAACYQDSEKYVHVMSMWNRSNIRRVFFEDHRPHPKLVNNFLSSLEKFYSYFEPGELPTISPENVQQGGIKSRNKYFGYDDADDT